MHRRTFVAAAASGAGLLAAARLGGSPTRLLDVLAGSRAERWPLPFAPVVAPTALTLTARVAEVAVGDTRARAWTFNGSVPGPTIRLRRGDRARMQLVNQLDEPTIAHWHGLHVPAAVDGHPRLAVGAGATYDYDFTVDQRAGTGWYHPHPHMRTAAQTFQGMAGFFIVEDDEEAALELPSGERELLLVLQDQRTSGGTEGAFEYDPVGPDIMQGMLGDTAFVNGVPTPSHDVEATLYRVRVLNAANARVYRLALGSVASLVVIGNDGGLLPAPVRVPYVDIGPAERVDLLVDFAGVSPGERVMLQSLPFTIPGLMQMGGMGGGMGGMGGRGGRRRVGSSPQGAAMELVEFVVRRAGGERAPIPARLSTVAALADGPVARQRSFRFASGMQRHTINGRAFDMHRVDERVPIGQLERWTFINDDRFAHPIHVHATHFQVVERRGGRGAVLPWEGGWKDTVLTLPGEQVDVLIRFDANPGLFLLHCHNLEHEDSGMMLNCMVEA